MSFRFRRNIKLANTFWNSYNYKVIQKFVVIVIEWILTYWEVYE